MLSNRIQPLCVTFSSRDEVFSVISDSALLPPGVRDSVDKIKRQLDFLHTSSQVADHYNTSFPEDPLKIKYIKQE